MHARRAPRSTKLRAVVLLLVVIVGRLGRPRFCVGLRAPRRALGFRRPARGRRPCSCASRALALALARPAALVLVLVLVLALVLVSCDTP